MNHFFQPMSHEQENLVYAGIVCLVILVGLLIFSLIKVQNLRKELRYQHIHDLVTGLINRAEFIRILNVKVKQFNNCDQASILCHLDLDFFKIINDSAGYVAGEFLLKDIVRIVQQHLGDTDVLARLGADEFAILFSKSSLSSVEKLCQIIINETNDFRFHWNQQVYRIGLSIGMVEWSNPNYTVDQLLSDADVACYAAKTAGRNQLSIFDRDKTYSAEYSNNISLLTHIYEAIEHDRLVFYCQKIVSTQPDQANYEAYEILVRIKKDLNTIIEANNFVVIAEQYNVMTVIDRWVLTNVLKIYDKQLANLPASVFYINISANSLNTPKFLEYLLNLIHLSAIAPERLCFEITETAAMSHMTKTMEIVSALQAIGCKIALDDFGVGLSSFNYIKNFSVNMIKIDGSFVKNAPHSEVDKAIIDTINDMAHRLGMQTVAEYVENEEIFTVIREIGIDFAQGYAIGKPEPLSTLIDMPILLDAK